MLTKKTNKELLLFIIGCFVVISIFLINYSFVSAEPISTHLQVPIPGFQEGKIDVEVGTNTLADYIRAIYQLSIKVISILAVLALMIGGLIWLTSAGSEKQVSTAKNIIRNSLIALLIVLFSYPLLYFINPSFTRLKDLSITKIETAEFINLANECIIESPVTGKDEDEMEDKCLESCKLYDSLYKVVKKSKNGGWGQVRKIVYYHGSGDTVVGGCCSCFGTHLPPGEVSNFNLVWISNENEGIKTRSEIQKNLDSYARTRKEILEKCGGTLCRNESVEDLYKQTETYKRYIMETRCQEYCQTQNMEAYSSNPADFFIYECRCQE